MGKQWNQWQTLFSWAPESLQMVTATMKLKTLAPWKKTYDQPRQCIKKQRQGEAVRNNSATLGQGPGSTSKDTHNIFELFQRTKIPNKHINYLMRHSSFQRGHSLITSRTTEAHQEATWYWIISGLKECRPCRHPNQTPLTPPTTTTTLNLMRDVNFQNLSLKYRHGGITEMSLRQSFPFQNGMQGLKCQSPWRKNSLIVQLREKCTWDRRGQRVF